MVGRVCNQELTKAPCIYNMLLQLTCLLLATAVSAAPKVMVISHDGATPWLVELYLASGELSLHQGLGL